MSSDKATSVARSGARLASSLDCKSSPNIGGLKLAPCALVICTSQPALFRLRAFDTAACGFSRSVCTRCPSLEAWIVNVMIDSSRPRVKAITSVTQEQEEILPQCSAGSSPGIARPLNNWGLWTGCGHLETSEIRLPPGSGAIFPGDRYRTMRSKQAAVRGFLSACRLSAKIPHRGTRRVSFPHPSH